MARKNLIRSNFFPYHVVNRTLDQKFYDLDKGQLWNIYSDCLCILSWVYGVKVHAFVLMGNHYHLLLSTPDENLDDAIRYLQTIVSKAVGEATGHSAFRFESRYKWSIIYESEYFINSLRYVYQNPMRAGICKKLEDYPLSSAHGQLGYSNLKFPVFKHDLQAGFCEGCESMRDFEDWVNEMFVESDLDKIRAALRRFEFKYPKRDSNACKKVSGMCKK